MKKFKIRTIEDIALQFIKHNEPKKTDDISSNDTLKDSKLIIKKYVNSKNSDSVLSQSFERLIPLENKQDDDASNKLKLIEFYKIPQKVLGDDDDCAFDAGSNAASVVDRKVSHSSSKMLTQNSFKLLSNGEIKLREIKAIKYTKKLQFNLNFQNIYDCLKELYTPLLQNLESISSLKSTTEITISCFEFFLSHLSIFELKQNNGSNYLPEIMEELKIFEIVQLCMVLFILHIILEAKMDFIDNFNEDDILIVYQDSYLALQKLYEIIILLLLFNENNANNKNKNSNANSNTNNISFENLCSQYIKEYYKYEQKPNDGEKIIGKINENISSILKILYNCCNILFGNLISFKKDSGNLEFPDEEEMTFINMFNNNNTSSTNNNINNNNKQNQKEEKIFLSKEFNDQYSCYKTMYLYFTKNSQNELTKTKSTFKDKEKENNKDDTDNNYDLLSPTESSVILTRLTSVFSCYKEMSTCFLLYFTNFKILLEKNKVKPPFLPPLDTKKYTYTLVVDLDETLVHYIEEENRAFVQVRPYADYFLTEMGKYFEIVIFTAAAEDYADIVLNELDKNNVINFKLYRKHTEQINGIFIKDLSKLGRDINKVIIIDNNKDNFSLQPENGLHICSFVGDQNDDELYSLSEDLMKIVNSKKDDIRPIIKEIDDIMKDRYSKKDVVLE